MIELDEEVARRVAGAIESGNVLTAAYVASLRGTNAAGGRQPEGNEIPPWGTE